MWLLVALLFADLAPVEKDLTAGRFREALSLLERAESSPRRHLLASKAYEGLNDPSRAVAEAEASLALDPNYEAAHLQLGYIFLSRNTPMAAVEVFTDAERLFPKSIVVRLGKGLALKELQRYDEAEKVLADCWPHPIAFDGLATVLVQRSKFDEAKSWAMRFVEVNPGDYRGYYFLAAARDGQGDTSAEEALQQSLKRKPDFAASHALLGKIQLRKGQFEAAAHSFQRAIRYRPDLKQAHLQLAQSYRKLGREDDARREFEIVRELNEKEAQPKPSLRYHRGIR